MSQPRRQFLKATVCAVCAGGLLRSVTVAGAALRRELKKGYMLGAFPGAANTPLLRQFEMLKAAGFHGVEPRSLV